MSRWEVAGFDVLCRHWCASRVCTCGIEHLDGEWLVLVYCAATDACLEFVLVELNVYMGNGWF